MIIMDFFMAINFFYFIFAMKVKPSLKIEIFMKKINMTSMIH